MTIDYSRVYTELDLHETELRVLVAAITHYMVYQRPLARHHELDAFIDRYENFLSSGIITDLIKRGLLQVVGRNSVCGGEHLLQHTPRAERLLGLRADCAAARERFWDEIRGVPRPEAAE